MDAYGLSDTVNRVVMPGVVLLALLGPLPLKAASESGETEPIQVDVTWDTALVNGDTMGLGSDTLAEAIRNRGDTATRNDTGYFRYESELNAIIETILAGKYQTAARRLNDLDTEARTHPAYRTLFQQLERIVRMELSKSSLPDTINGASREQR